MPMLDMPIERLEQYTGCTPKPRDFKEFWERGLEEVSITEPCVERIAVENKVPYADYYELYFNGVRGARLHARLIIPVGEMKYPALLQFHGYRGNAGNWFDKLPYVAAGVVVAALDCRGQAGSSQDTGGIKGTTMDGHFIRGLDDEPDNMLMRHTILDTVQLARVVMELDEVDETRVGTWGESQGGALALACAALEPRIRKTVASFPFLADYRRVWELDLTEEAYSELRNYFRNYDPLHEREEEIFTRLGYIDIQNLAPFIQADTLMALTLMDRVCPPSTQFAVYNKIKNKKEAVVYPDFGHEQLPGFIDRTLEFLLDI